MLRRLGRVCVSVCVCVHLRLPRVCWCTIIAAAQPAHPAHRAPLGCAKCGRQALLVRLSTRSVLCQLAMRWLHCSQAYVRVCVCVRLQLWSTGRGHGGCLCKRPSALQSFVCVPSCNTPTHSLQGLRVHVCHHRCAACECAVCERAHVRVRCAACAAAIGDQRVVHLLLCKSAPMRAPTCKCTCARGLWYMCARPSGAAVVPCSPCRAV